MQESFGMQWWSARSCGEVTDATEGTWSYGEVTEDATNYLIVDFPQNSIRVIRLRPQSKSNFFLRLEPPSPNRVSGPMQPIVEETLTSGKYVSLFLISILNIYIWNLKNYMTTGIIFEKNNAKTGKQRKQCKWRDQMHHFFIILQVTMSIAIVYRSQ